MRDWGDSAAARILSKTRYMRHLRMRVEGEGGGGGGGGGVIYGRETLMQGALELSQFPFFRFVSAKCFVLVSLDWV